MVVAARLFFLVIQENPEHDCILQATASDAAGCLEKKCLKAGAVDVPLTRHNGAEKYLPESAFSKSVQTHEKPRGRK